MNLQKQNFDFVFKITILTTIVLILIVLSLNLTYPFLWFDEAVSFWIAKGVKIDAEPFTIFGGLKEMIYFNRYYNLDPGGFSFILYFWTKFSENHIFLRFLPFILYVMSFILCFKIIKNILIHKSLALFISCGFLFFSNYYCSAFELRAYSFELFSTLLCILSIQSLDINTTFKFKISHSIMIALFMTGRYPSIIISFISLVIIFYSSVPNNKKPIENIKFLLVLFIPFIIITTIIYFIFYRYQKEFSHQLPYLNYLNNDVLYLLSPINLFFVISLIFISIYYLKQRNKLLLFSLIVNLFFIFLSIIGKYPYDPSSTRCNFITLSIFISLIIILKKPLVNLFEISYIKICLSFSLFYLTYTFLSVFLPRFDKPAELYSVLNSLDFNRKPKIYVDRWSNPSLRYLYEYGNLSHKRIKHFYPKNFKLMSDKKSHLNTIDKIISKYKNNKKMNELMNFDIIIGAEFEHYTDEITRNKWEKVISNESFFTKKK